MNNPISQHEKPCVACGAAMQEVHSWVWRCSVCGLETSMLFPGAGGGVDGLEALRRDNFERMWSELAGDFPKTAIRLLEIGCARGWFLELAQSRGYSVVGVEPGEYGEEARAKGFEVLTGLFPKVTNHFADGSFDIIVFNDVFEHLPNPIEALVECSRLLADGGMLILNLPVSSGALYSVSKILRRFGWSAPYDRLWQKGYSSPHLFYYAEKPLKRLLGNTIGFRLRTGCKLRSTLRNGLWKRVKSGANGVPQAVVIFALMVVFTIVETILPPDIKVFVFEKDKE